jgi:hypothetical protein
MTGSLTNEYRVWLWSGNRSLSCIRVRCQAQVPGPGTGTRNVPCCNPGSCNYKGNNAVMPDHVTTKEGNMGTDKHGKNRRKT